MLVVVRSVRRYIPSKGAVAEVVRSMTMESLMSLMKLITLPC